MNFNEKLKELRIQKGLTQEELAEALFVSRTAISKWESGRGLPSIDSLKAIADYFGLTIDELLTSRQVLTIAEEDRKEKENRYLDLVFGLLDLSVLMLLFLPFFGQSTGEAVENVSLLNLSGAADYVRSAYFAVAAGLTGWGILLLVLQGWRHIFWVRYRSKISLAMNVAGVLLFIVSQQPYAAVLLFVFLLIKVLVLLKKQ